MANRGNDSEAIISHIPFATKVLEHFSFPLAWVLKANW